MAPCLIDLTTWQEAMTRIADLTARAAAKQLADQIGDLGLRGEERFWGWDEVPGRASKKEYRRSLFVIRSAVGAGLRRFGRVTFDITSGPSFSGF